MSVWISILSLTAIGALVAQQLRLRAAHQRTEKLKARREMLRYIDSNDLRE